MSKPTRMGWWHDPNEGIFGERIPERSIRPHNNTHALHYGTGAFEGIRAYRLADGGGRAIFRLTDHLRRLEHSSALLGMRELPFTLEDLERACQEVLAANPEDTYLRPLVYRGRNPDHEEDPGKDLGVNPLPSVICASVVTLPWKKYLASGLHNDGVTAIVSAVRRPDPEHWPVIRGKCCANYATNQLMKQWALELGAAEAILLAPEGPYVSEGTGMNLCIVKKGKLITPDEDSSALNGITLQTAFWIAEELLGLRTEIRPVRIDELFDADEVFFTGTATEVTPVTMINGREVGGASPGLAGSVTNDLRELYREIVTGARLSRDEWLTFVPDRVATPASV